MILQKKSIRGKYLLSGLAICLVSLVLVSVISYLVSAKITREQSNLRVEEAVLKNSIQLDAWFKQYGKVLEGMAEDLEISGNFDQDHLYRLFAGKNGIYQADVMDFYLGFADPQRVLVSGSNWIPDPGYDCRTRPWYVKAMQSTGVIFTQPYVDAQTGKMVITMARTIKKDDQPIGVIAADMYVTNIIHLVEEYRLNQNSYAFLLDDEGNFMTHPDKNFLPDETGLKNIADVQDVAYQKLLPAIQSNSLASILIKDYDGQDKYFMLNKISSSGWVFGIAILKSEYQKPLNYLLMGYVFAFLLSMLAGIAIMLKLISQMIKPIKSLSETVTGFSVTNMDLRTEINSDDEIGELGKSFNQMADTIQEYSTSLENKVAQRTKELQEKNDDIMESIDYAYRLQKAILPNLPERLEIPPEKLFVIWKPRDIVGGDFYWCRGNQRYSVLVVADCTGHGVPGALMTMTLNSILDGMDLTVNIKQPAEILQEMDSRLKETLRQSEKGSTADDGADVAVCLIDRNNKTLVFAGAKLSLFVSREGEVTEYRGAKRSVGYVRTADVPFTDTVLNWQAATGFYLATDGLFDQNLVDRKGGIGRAGFHKLLEASAGQTMADQQSQIEAHIHQCLAAVEQRDDITVLGFELA